LLIGQLGGLVNHFGILIGFGIATAKFCICNSLGAIIAAITSFIVAIASGLYPAIKAAVLIQLKRYDTNNSSVQNCMKFFRKKKFKVTDIEKGLLIHMN
jgi:hypothetical protein